MQKKKNTFILRRFIPYMGKKKILLPLALILSGISTALNILPFVLVWYIVRDILSSPQSIENLNVSSYAWLAFASAIGGLVIYFAGLNVFPSGSFSRRSWNAKSRYGKNIIDAAWLFR